MENQAPLSAPQSPAPVQVPKNSKKRAIVLIVLGLVLIAATAPFLYQKYFAPQEPTEALIVSEFSDWKTYRNEEYGFEFKYPRNYSISKNINTNIAPAIESEYGWFEFRIVSDQYSKQLLSEQSGGVKLNINGISFIELPIGGNRDNGIVYEVMLEQPNNNDYLAIFFTTTKSDTEPKIDEFKQILSTFKFTK